MSKPKNDKTNKLFWNNNSFMLSEEKLELPQCN